MPPGAKQLQDLAFLALVHRVRDGITAIDGVECSGDHLSTLQHDFWSSSPPSAGGCNLRRALEQFPVARNPHAGVVARRGPVQLRRHASNSDLAFMLYLLRNMASTTAFRQPNRAGRWVLSTRCSRSPERNSHPEPVVRVHEQRCETWSRSELVHRIPLWTSPGLAMGWRPLGTLSTRCAVPPFSSSCCLPCSGNRWRSRVRGRR